MMVITRSAGYVLCLITLATISGCYAGAGFKDWTSEVPQNRAPRIQSLSANGSSGDNIEASPGQRIVFTCLAVDPDGDPIQITWHTSEVLPTPAPVATPTPIPAATPTPAASPSPSPSPSSTSTPGPVANREFVWSAPNTTGIYVVTCTVQDNTTGVTAESIKVEVKAK